MTRKCKLTVTEPNDYHSEADAETLAQWCAEHDINPTEVRAEYDPGQLEYDGSDDFSDDYIGSESEVDRVMALPRQPPLWITKYYDDDGEWVLVESN